jgi:hypothetical protein
VGNVAGDEESLTYAMTRAWWTPALLVLTLVAQQIHASPPQWWSLVDVAFLLAVVLVLYVGTHPVLTGSLSAITTRRGPLRVPS